MLIATGSAHKLGELRELMRLERSRMISLAETSVVGEPVEDGLTFRANALIKARFYGGLAGLPTIADDSGVEVDALGGAPGVRTRRYAGEDATDAQNNAKLLDALRDVPPVDRTARYRCVLAFFDPATGRTLTRMGTLEGRIALGPSGSAGFGYDPIFECVTAPYQGMTVAQLRPDEKHRVSHRGRAARALARALRESGY